MREGREKFVLRAAVALRAVAVAVRLTQIAQVGDDQVQTIPGRGGRRAEREADGEAERIRLEQAAVTATAAPAQQSVHVGSVGRMDETFQAMATDGLGRSADERCEAGIRVHD